MSYQNSTTNRYFKKISRILGFAIFVLLFVALVGNLFFAKNANAASLQTGCYVIQGGTGTSTHNDMSKSDCTGSLTGQSVGIAFLYFGGQGNFHLGYPNNTSTFPQAGCWTVSLVQGTNKTDVSRNNMSQSECLTTDKSKGAGYNIYINGDGSAQYIDSSGKKQSTGKSTQTDDNAKDSANNNANLNDAANSTATTAISQTDCKKIYGATWTTETIAPGQTDPVTGKPNTSSTSSSIAYCKNSDGTVASQQDVDNASSTSDSGSTCNAGGGLGFIICPLMTMLSKAIDSVYGLLSNILAIPVEVFTNPAVNAAYQTFLPIANTILAIVFLFIIYSEATGNGFGAMNNYSIKKTLPRLIIFAALVNLSFWICAAAVDVSNIVGSGMYNLFAGSGQSSLKSEFTNKTQTMIQQKDGN